MTHDTQALKEAVGLATRDAHRVEPGQKTKNRSTQSFKLKSALCLLADTLCLMPRSVRRRGGAHRVEPGQKPLHTILQALCSSSGVSMCIFVLVTKVN